jgi:ABC-type transport system involved in multi-copper enzyme maturation permease subunit
MTLKMIKTDWLAIKSHHWRLIIMAAIVVFFGVSGMGLFIIPIAAYMAMSFSMNTFAVEEKGKLDHLYLSLPISRKNVVQGRFAFMLVLLIVALAICAAVVLLASPTLNLGELSVTIEPKVIALMCFVGFAFGGFINLCMYPIMFRLGYEKGKIFGFYIPIVIVGAVMGTFAVLINKKLELISRLVTYWFENVPQVCGVLFVAGGILFFSSYVLSLWQYNKRDL